jgi:predicted aldo/keto reductase-like oxidoreductase
MGFDSPVVLGRSGLVSARLGIGADQGIDAGALQWAFESGINYFYWGSRRAAGMRDAIRQLAPGQRERLIIALQSYDTTGLTTTMTFRRGLAQLRIEYADVLILGKRDAPLTRRALDSALALREAGLVRRLCISAHDRSQYQAHLALGVFDLVMVRYNCAHPGAEREVFPLLEAEAERPGVLCYNTTRWGHLFDPAWMPPGEPAPTPNHLYRFALSHPVVDMVLTAPKDQAQLESNLTTLQQGPLDPDERAWLERVGKHVHGLTPHGNWDFLSQGRGPRRA